MTPASWLPQSSVQQFSSGVYLGQVRHLRRAPRHHSFEYEMGMLVLDLDEIPQLESCSRWFSASGFAPLSFRAGDYLRDGVGKGQQYCVRSLKKRVELKLVQLGASKPCSQIVFAGQIRHFGWYFSPVNFFFGYQAGRPIYLLAEVSNTPWNERHYYLVDLAAVDSQARDKVVDTCDKAFHVSPFMDLNMKYLWRVTPPAQQLRIGIDNQGEQRLFSASLELVRQPFTPVSLASMVRRFPLMTGRILAGIYWQALRLWVKGVPFIGHPGGLKSALKSDDPQS
ncbi:DUF1365 domain-containing protein [Shewanella sp. GXUN23E]|uniref:DUF1365 domain-containing protein n=1 Tax=Shewanella sp. GXUN23E TaxID=3422498 RepID=UPI003D7DACE5